MMKECDRPAFILGTTPEGVKIEHPTESIVWAGQAALEICEEVTS